MFSWGEQCRRGFRLKDGTYQSNNCTDGVVFLDLGFHITHLSAGLRVLAFVKSNGNAFIIRVLESKDGTRVRGKQKCVELKEKVRAVGCQDDVVLLLSQRGQVLCVDTTQPHLKPRPLEALRTLAVSQVSCGSQHSIVLTKDGQVFTWGLDSRGQLGLGMRRPGATSPQQVRTVSDLPLVQVAAGGEQSFGLSVSGAVFSWGSNSCGQLGLGDTTDRHTPTLVYHLNMKKSCHVSCGETHTAVLTKDGAVFTFGSGRQGQLGHNSFKDELRPRLVVELWGSKVTAVTCGRQHTVVLTQSQKMYSFGCGDQGQLGRGDQGQLGRGDQGQLGGGDQGQLGGGDQGQLGHGPHTHPAVPLPVQLPQDHSHQPRIRNIFSGGNCSFAACSLQDTDTESVTSEAHPTVDNLLNRWTSESEPWKQTKQEIHRTLSSAACFNRSFLDQRKHFATSTKQCGLDLSAAHSSFSKLLNKPQVLEAINRQTAGPQRIPETVFCTPVTKDMLTDMLLWHLEPEYRTKLGGPPILCSFPFLMDLKTRKYALNLNNHYIMYGKVDDWSEFCFNEDEDEFQDNFILYLRRECVMVDSFRQLSVTHYRDFKRPLVVYFNDLMLFDKVNQKDFFHLVFHEMVSAESGMFMFNDSSTLAWFSSKATHPDEHYFLFGVLCGLALFNNHIIFLPFPLALFKKLLGVEPSLDDLCELSPCTGTGLKCLLLEYSDKVIESLDMDFQIHWDGMDVDLDPNSLERPVTGQNKTEFVEAYVDHVFNSSVDGAFEEFRRGFFQVCDRHVVELFTPEELRDLVVGQEFNDWARFKQSTFYKGIFHESHPTVQMFWEVFEEMTEEQKKALLWFVTGFERVPILSEQQQQQQQKMMTVQELSNRDEALSQDQYFPKSHTCFSALELPLYSTKDMMKTKLSEALALISPNHDEAPTDNILTFRFE